MRRLVRPANTQDRIIAISACSAALFGVFSTNATFCAESNDPAKETLPLEIKQPEPNRFQPYLDVSIDSKTKRFLLDTGEVTTRVGSDSDFSKYPALNQISNSTGTFSQSAAEDVIRPHLVQIGSHRFLNAEVRRTKSNDNTLGIDFISKSPFEIDFQGSKLAFIPKLPDNLTRHELYKFHTGHFGIPVTVGGVATTACFDTGSGITLIDKHFVDAHPDQFTVVGKELGKDSKGVQKETDVVKASALKLGDLELKDVEMISFPFSKDFRQSMDGKPMLLGSYAISRAKWYIDYHQKSWAIEPYTSDSQ